MTEGDSAQYESYQYTVPDATPLSTTMLLSYVYRSSTKYQYDDNKHRFNQKYTQYSKIVMKNRPIGQKILELNMWEMRVYVKKSA